MVNTENIISETKEKSGHNIGTSYVDKMNIEFSDIYAQLALVCFNFKFLKMNLLITNR